MEGILLIQSEELGEPGLGNTEATNSVPASHDFNSHIPRTLALFFLPIFVQLFVHSSLVSIPDAFEPLAGHLLLEDSKLADHPCQAAAGEAAARETKEKDFIVRVIVVHKEVVRRKDVVVESPAKAACIDGYHLILSIEHSPHTHNFPRDISLEV